MLAQAATDNYYVKSPGVPPVGPGYWIPAPRPAPIVRSLDGVRPFFLTSAINCVRRHRPRSARLSFSPRSPRSGTSPTRGLPSRSRSPDVGHGNAPVHDRIREPRRR